MQLKRWKLSDSTRLLHNQRLWSQCLQLLLPVDAAEIMAGSKPVMFATRPLQNSTGFCSSSGCWTISLFKGLYFCQTWSCCCGIFGNFPRKSEKGHNKNNIFHHVILEKTPLFILFSHIFVYYFSLSTFWFSRAKNLSPSPLHWNPLKPPSPFDLPLKFQSFFQLSNPLRSFAQQTAQAHMVPGFLFHVMETHEASLGKFMPDPCKIDGLMPFWGVQWGPPGEQKTARRFTNSKMQNFGMPDRMISV